MNLVDCRVFVSVFVFTIQMERNPKKEVQVAKKAWQKEAWSQKSHEVVTSKNEMKRRGESSNRMKTLQDPVKVDHYYI